MIKKTKIARKIEDDFDFDFRAETSEIKSIRDFEQKILVPSQDNKQIYYRGERKNSITRPLLPSIYRKRDFLFNSSKKVDLVTNQKLYSFYSSIDKYFDLYQNTVGEVTPDKMYSFLAFSQHYFGVSPLIDFTKDIYVALSFALKDRKQYDNDILLYTLEINDMQDYTSSIDTANKWIEDYSVLLFNDKAIFDLQTPLDAISDYIQIAEKHHGKSFLELNAPTAKLIDVPTNDLLQYQQGVFLLLDDFSLLGKSYFTKKIRDDFNLKKWIINKDICPTLLDMLNSEKPYYSYKNITNLRDVVDEIKKEYVK